MYKLPSSAIAPKPASGLYGNGSFLTTSNDNLAFINTNYINNGYPLKGSALYSSTPGKSRIIFRMPYVGAGFEYAFTEADRKNRAFIPFIGVDFIISIITGKYVQTAKTAPYLQGVETPFIIKTDARLGFGAGAGMDIRFTQGFGMVFGFKYKYANLILKTSDYLFEENKMNILDKAATDLNTNLSEDRNIGYMEFYLGAAFFVGKSKK